LPIIESVPAFLARVGDDLARIFWERSMHWLGRSALLAGAGILFCGASAQAQGPGAATFVRPAGTFATPTPYRGQAAMYQTRTVPTGRPAKPFTNVFPMPTVSPYLALDVREGDTGLPAYHMFVKPQLEQQQFNAVQQAQYQRLQGQVRAASVNVAPGPDAGVSTADHRSRFMNYGGYFPAAR
jgi:hypothetical protein